MSITFKQLNLTDITSELVNNFEVNNETDLDILILYEIDVKLLNDFNNRSITPDNINKIIYMHTDL